MTKRGKLKGLLVGFVIVVIFGLGGLSGFLYARKRSVAPKIQPKNKQIAFLDEVYTIVKDNYWQRPEEQNLDELMMLGIEKLTGRPANIDEPDKNKVFDLATDILSKIEQTDKKNQFAASLADIVLANLKPQGRSRLYTQKQEKDLRNRVNRVDPETDHYDTLQVDKQASKTEIDQAYKEKEQQVKTDTEKQALKQAYQTLSDEKNRQRYDQSGINPTLVWEIHPPDILYVHLTKFSPTTVEDLQNVMKQAEQKNDQLNTLIFDLQDNVGGAIDYLPVFLGPFIGRDQYAYAFYHQGGNKEFKTKTGWMAEMVRYKKVVILINGQTQSSAEVVAATLKKYNVGVLAGTTTKGWGTVEKVFPLKNQLSSEEKHSVFLVHSLTLADNNQFIEENGISPLINVDGSDWQSQLNAYFNYPRLTELVKQLVD